MLRTEYISDEHFQVGVARNNELNSNSKFQKYFEYASNSSANKKKDRWYFIFEENVVLRRNGWHRDRMDRETPYFTYLVRGDTHMWNCNHGMTVEKKVRIFFSPVVSRHVLKEKRGFNLPEFWGQTRGNNISLHHAWNLVTTSLLPFPQRFIECPWLQFQFGTSAFVAGSC